MNEIPRETNLIIDAQIMHDVGVAVQLYDDLGSDRSCARYVAFNAPVLRSGQFVVISCGASGRSYLGQVAGAQLNLNRNALGATDNIAINQLEQINDGSMSRSVAVKEYFLYDLQLLKEIVTGRPESVRVRPQIGAKARPATDEEVINLLGLPSMDELTRIGVIIDTDVPICVSKQVLVQHVLVAGAVGSGKTNTIANTVNAARNQGMGVFLFDHKPDYQHVHLANDDGAEPHFEGIEDVVYWYIGEPMAIHGRKESRIAVPARDLDPSMLVSVVFHYDGEELQRETCDYLLQHYIDEQRGAWTLSGFRAWLDAFPDGKAAPGQPDTRTFGAVRRKLRNPGRIPRWVDTQPQSNFFTSDAFKPDELVTPGRVVVIRIGSEAGDGREYGLLLSYILGKIHEHAAAHKLPCPLLVGIDEAQDIFSASKQFKQIALAMLDRMIRKGRLLRIGYLIGVQSADAVPDSILNYVNSRIIHRHNSHDQVKIAALAATEDQRRMTNTFGSGETLVFLIGSNGMVHAKLRRSPFRLTKEEL